MSEEVKKFSKLLRSNDIKKIVAFIKAKNPDLNTREKVDTIIHNLCHLNIKTIENMIKLMRLDYKHKYGLNDNLYLKSVECKDHIFGFINSYYSIDEKNKYNAYIKASYLGRIDILKKIRGLSPERLRYVYNMIKNKKPHLKETIHFVESDLNKATANKEVSVSYLLNRKLGNKAYVKTGLLSNSATEYYPNKHFKHLVDEMILISKRK